MLLVSSYEIYLCYSQKQNTKMYKKISIMWSDFWINILLIQKNQNINNINNIYERTAKEYIQLESYFR